MVAAPRLRPTCRALPSTTAPARHVRSTSPRGPATLWATPSSPTHPNDDDVTYALSGTNADLFTVDAETGQVRLGAGAALTPGQTYTVNVTATDESGASALIIVEIEVVDTYDLNGDGAIEKEEVVNAVSDYFAGIIDKKTVVALLARYFAG